MPIKYFQDSGQSIYIKNEFVQLHDIVFYKN